MRANSRRWFLNTEFFLNHHAGGGTPVMGGWWLEPNTVHPQWIRHLYDMILKHRIKFWIIGVLCSDPATGPLITRPAHIWKGTNTRPNKFWMNDPNTQESNQGKEWDHTYFDYTSIKNYKPILSNRPKVCICVQKIMDLQSRSKSELSCLHTTWPIYTHEWNI